MGRRKSNSSKATMSQIVSPELCENLTKIVEAKHLVILNKPTGAEKAYFQIHEDVWYIAACWIAYKRYPAIDIARSPYNTPHFQAFKRWAYALNAQLDLTQVTFDTARDYPKIFKTIENYRTPMNLWLKCMEHLRQETSYGEPPPKEVLFGQMKSEITALSQDKMPKSVSSVHEEKLLKTVLALKKYDPEIKAKLDDYIRAINVFVATDSLRLFTLWVEEGKLLTRTGKNPSLYISPKVLEEIEKGVKSLGIITHGAWKDQIVMFSGSKDILSSL
jgi:hypothetical protein